MRSIITVSNLQSDLLTNCKFLCYITVLVMLLLTNMAVLARADENKLTCQEINGLIQAKTGLNLWNSFPNIVFNSDDRKDIDTYVKITGQDPFRMWRYLNSLCSNCSINFNKDPDIFLVPVENIDSLKGGPNLYAPETSSTRAEAISFLKHEISNQVNVFTSLNIIDKDFNPPRQITIISPLKYSLANNDIRWDFLISYFEAFVDVKFWANERLRDELRNELQSGCIDDDSKVCRVLRFGKYLYLNRNALTFHSANLDVALRHLCEIYTRN